MNHKKMNNNEKENFPVISYLVFFLALGIIIFHLIPLFFPALLVVNSYEFEAEINPFELGAWAGPVLASNIVLLVFGVLYFKKRLPSFVQDFVNFILNFEASKKGSIYSRCYNHWGLHHAYYTGPRNLRRR